MAIFLWKSLTFPEILFALYFEILLKKRKKKHMPLTVLNNPRVSDRVFDASTGPEPLSGRGARMFFPVPPDTLWNGPRTLLGEAQRQKTGSLYTTSPTPCHPVDWASPGTLAHSCHRRLTNSVREQGTWVTSRIYSVLHFMGRKKTMNEPLWPVSVLCSEMSVFLGSTSPRNVWLQRNGSHESSGGRWEACGRFWLELF